MSVKQTKRGGRIRLYPAALACWLDQGYCLAAGADHFLLKPFPIGTFTQILRTLLPGQGETRAIGQ